MKFLSFGHLYSKKKGSPNQPLFTIKMETYKNPYLLLPNNTKLNWYCFPFFELVYTVQLSHSSFETDVRAQVPLLIVSLLGFRCKDDSKPHAVGWVGVKQGTRCWGSSIRCAASVEGLRVGPARHLRLRCRLCCNLHPGILGFRNRPRLVFPAEWMII